MTQEYLNHLFETYPAVEKFYWTADSTAFATHEEAVAYSKKLGNPTILALEHGGELGKAVNADAVETPLGETQGLYLVDSEDTASAGDAKPTFDYEALSVPKLKELCASREIALNGATKKSDIIDLLVAADKATAETTETVNYTELDLAALQALCTEREIKFTDDADEAALIVALTEFDASQSAE